MVIKNDSSPVDNVSLSVYWSAPGVEGDGRDLKGTEYGGYYEVIRCDSPPVQEYHQELSLVSLAATAKVRTKSAAPELFLVSFGCFSAWNTLCSQVSRERQPVPVTGKHQVGVPVFLEIPRFNLYGVERNDTEGTMKLNRKTVRFFGLFVVLSVLTSVVMIVAPKPAKVASGTAEELRSAVKAFWDCRLAKDHTAIYEIYEPRLKQLATLEQFLGAKGLIDYYSFEIDNVSVDGDVGTANVSYTWKPNHPAFASMKVKEDAMDDEWLFVDGQWRKKFVVPSPTRDVDPSVGDPSSVRMINKDSELLK